MQQIEKELRLNQLRLIVIVTTLIFAFMLAYTIYWLIDYNQEYGFFEKASAEVIEHQEIDGKEYDLLSYKVDGNEFRITTEYESKNDVGDKITIYYDKNYPLGVVYSLDSRRIVLPILSSVFGVVNISLIVMYFLIRRGVMKENLEIVGSVDMSNSLDISDLEDDDKSLNTDIFNDMVEENFKEVKVKKTVKNSSKPKAKASTKSKD